MAKIVTNDIFDLSWGLAQLELRSEMRNWIRGAIRRQADIPWRGGHDEANYTCSWGNFYRLTGDEHIKVFLNWLRDTYREWSKVHEYHGFQAEPRDHSNHTFENAEQYIASLCEMDPDDPINSEIVEDIAHHVGNWVEGIPEWYDWKKHRFLSHWLGTRRIRNQVPEDFELAGHTRIGTVVLSAYKTSRNERYLDWCKDYAGKWVDTIMAAEDRIQVVTYGTEMDPEERRRIYNSGRERVGDIYLGMGWMGLTPHIINFLLKVYEVVKEPSYLEAIRKAIGLMEKRTGTNGRLLKHYMAYQNVTGETLYQDKVESWYEKNIKPALDEELMVPNTILVSKNRNRMYEPEVPKVEGIARNYGLNDNKGNITMYIGPTPEMYITGYIISGNVECMRRAMSLAANELFLVTYSTRDGREHGCEGQRYIHGMGREAAHTLYAATGIEKVTYYKADGTLGLEEDVAAIYDNSGDGAPVFYFYNHSDEDKTIKVSYKDDDINKAQDVVVKPKQVTKYEMK